MAQPQIEQILILGWKLPLIHPLIFRLSASANERIRRFARSF